MGNPRPYFDRHAQSCFLVQQSLEPEKELTVALNDILSAAIIIGLYTLLKKRQGWSTKISFVTLTSMVRAIILQDEPSFPASIRMAVVAFAKDHTLDLLVVQELEDYVQSGHLGTVEGQADEYTFKTKFLELIPRKGLYLENLPILPHHITIGRDVFLTAFPSHLDSSADMKTILNVLVQGCVVVAIYHLAKPQRTWDIAVNTTLLDQTIRRAMHHYKDSHTRLQAPVLNLLLNNAQFYPIVSAALANLEQLGYLVKLEVSNDYQVQVPISEYILSYR